MEYRRYVAEYNQRGEAVLADWEWLLDGAYTLWFVTKFGDAFLKRRDDGAISWLNTVEGTVERVAGDEQEFEKRCEQKEDFDTWFMPTIIDDSVPIGLTPGPNQCLSFKVPPKLGGQLLPDNLEVCDISVHFSIAGQLLRQIKDLPPGTKIGKVNIKAAGHTSIWERLKRLFTGS